MTAPLVSITTPMYYYAEFLKQAIRSVVDRDYPNLENIVVDGNSTDGGMDVNPPRWETAGAWGVGRR